MLAYVITYYLCAYTQCYHYIMYNDNDNDNYNDNELFIQTKSN